MLRTAVSFLHRHSRTNWALADQAMVSGCNFLTGMVLARGLGIADFGRYSLAWLVVAFVQSIQDNAITAPMMSIGPKQSVQERPAYYGGVFLQQGVLAIVSTLLAWACVRFATGILGDRSVAPLAMPLAAAVLLCQAQEFLRRYFFTLQNPAVSFAGDAIRYISQLGVLLWMFFVLKTGRSVSATLLVMGGASGASTLATAMFIGRLGFPSSALRQSTLRNWRFSRWLVGSAIVQWMSGNLFVVAAGALLGVAAVGALRAAQSLMGLTNILFLGLENIVPIRAAQRYHAGGAADLLRYLARVTRLGVAATAVTGVVFAISPAFWLRLLFGEQFAQYGFLVRWFAALYVLTFVPVSLRFGLRAMERTVSIFVGYVAAAMFSLAAGYPLVKQLGLTGVLTGLFLVQVLQLGVMAATYGRVLVELHGSSLAGKGSS